MATIDTTVYYNSFIFIDYNNDTIYKKLNNTIKKIYVSLKYVNLF